MGPITPKDRNGNKYILSYISDCENFNQVYLLKRKDEQPKRFAEYDELMKKQYGLIVKILRSDNDTEYKNATMTKYCVKRGILQQYSQVHTPEQNGKAERFNRTLLDSSRTMLNSTTLPKKFWGESTKYCSMFKIIYLLGQIHKGIAP